MFLNRRHTLSDGSELGLLWRGGGAGPRPAVLLLSEIFGVNAAMDQAAAAFAREGYLVVAPDLYHRIAPGCALLYSHDERQQALALWARLDTPGLVGELAELTAWVRGQPECDGGVAAVGFCLGGQLALLLALEEATDAAVAFYPVKVGEYAGRLGKLRRPAQVHAGDSDPHLPAETLRLLQEGLADAPDAEMRVYPGADHGFYNAVRAFGHHPGHAAAAHQATLHFLTAHLRGAPRSAQAPGR